MLHSILAKGSSILYNLSEDYIDWVAEALLSIMPPKFVPRQRKQKQKQRENAAPPVDTNAFQLPAVPKGEKESRKQELREELRAQHTKVSAKKQKRLDKYIVRFGRNWSIN